MNEYNNSECVRLKKKYVNHNMKIFLNVFEYPTTQIHAIMKIILSKYEKMDGGGERERERQEKRRSSSI